MKVILTQDIESVGRRGDVVNVARGYGRNFLLPRRLAIEVTASNLKAIELEKKTLLKKNEEERRSFQSLIEKLSGLSLTFVRKAGEKDHIFGSVSAGDIRDALAAQGFEVDKKKIGLDEPIKRLGSYIIPVRIYHDDKAEIRVEVKPEEPSGESAPAES
ncbi:MAG: 50S ribosomal protein L9 [Candidatus Aminicenantes bacterium]|nr:50S ribosomal protein L9 [Candidatus Aminicenantes bacterium]